MTMGEMILFSLNDFLILSSHLPLEYLSYLPLVELERRKQGPKRASLAFYTLWVANIFAYF